MLLDALNLIDHLDLHTGYSCARSELVNDFQRLGVIEILRERRFDPGYAFVLHILQALSPYELCTRDQYQLLSNHETKVVI